MLCNTRRIVTVSENDTGGWSPEDGAGYIPTEEGGAGRDEYSAELSFREWMRVVSSLSASANINRSKDLEGMANKNEAVKHRIIAQVRDGGRHVPPSGLLDRLEREARDVAENPRPRQTQAYANGVAAGIRYVIGEMEDNDS